jgi:Cdc6-like AAA superfamily ATPase
MDIQDYVAKKEQQLKGATRRIRDFKVFDFNYIPDRPLMREEVKPIADALLRYQKTGIANHLLVFGSRGCGKTLTVRYLARLLGQSGLQSVYVNCRSHNTSFKILAECLGVKPRGCSLSELWQRFCEAHGARTVLVLDEVDLLSDRDKHKDILYLVSRSPENYMAVLLSNNPKLLSMLDESVRSTLQPEVVHFRNYTAPQILEILRERSAAGLAAQDDPLLQQIAALTARNTNSDVRVAIKTLYYMTIEPGEALQASFERARRDILGDVIQDLNDKTLLILRAAVDEENQHARSVYDRYCVASERVHEEPFSYVHFYSSLSYLQGLGLILLVSTKVGKTYTNRIQPLFDRSLFEAVWRARFG